MPVVRPPLDRLGADPGRRRLLGALLGAPLLASGGLAGCSDGAATSTQDGPVELSVFWWGGAKRAELTEKALRLYSERNPRVTFRVTWQGADGYYDRLATQAVGGNVPDLIQIDDSMLTEYTQRQIILDLTEQVADHRLDLRGLSEGLIRYGTVEGRTMAVAGGQTHAAVVFNRDLLRELRVPEPRGGMTWAEYVSWAEQVTDASDGQVAGTMDASGDYRALWLWLRSQGGEFYRGNQLGFGADELIAWFELWQRARSGRATPGAALVEQADSGEPARQLVVTGLTAASFAWSHQLPELQRLTESELGIVGLPGPTGAQWARASMYWAAFRGTRHPDAVADVINFLTTNGEAGTVLGHERGLNPSLPVRRYAEGSITDPAQKRVAAFGASIDDLLGPAPAPPPKGHPKVRTLLVTAAERIRVKRDGTREATARFLSQAIAALAA
ncbi:ABC transporter substrate-binding protein [Micromonospora parathelypteridis]|uniref:Multiple sugar transport system substrate-binding protein n=1 Tax=Micromonospora parathelypteridis TaxID=1839617 RepID=A0A840VTU6_9ACTN|nr:extracellular solute-binding protein [Micromonospora parathelypteridis]MBB5477374.1 multiple sugar transport system substrate-binding protein [Micromonospora parathelypteridis]GGO09586.1 sugar ABC transporter substrate-binding protein [Micromonospora parathelypteridis]